MTAAEFATLIIAGALATYLWRFIGALAASRIAVDSPAFGYARAVAAALVAALVARFVYAPSGRLADSETWMRAAALAAGLAVFYAARRNVPAGVAAAVLALLILTRL